MKILIIGYTHPKYDKRVFRTVKTLAMNHEIIYQYLANNDEVQYKEGNITYLPLSNKIIPEENEIRKLLDRKPFDKKISELVMGLDYNILYMHHFLATKPLEPFKIAKKRGKKVVYDIHEYHPENFLAGLNGIAGNIKITIMSHIFKKQLELSDLCIFVSEEMVKDVLRNSAISNKKIFLLPNYASMSIEPDASKKRKEIIYVGKITRQLDDEKKIVGRLVEHGFSFRIIGMDSSEFADIPRTYTPFLPYEEMMEEISKASFSLISYNTVENRKYKNDIFALPNKFFDSIAAGTPVIVKESFVSMAKQVRDLGLGVVINPLNVEESMQKILDAYNNYDTILKNIETHQDEFVWNQSREEEFIRKIEEVIME